MSVNNVVIQAQLMSPSPTQDSLADPNLGVQRLMLYIDAEDGNGTLIPVDIIDSVRNHSTQINALQARCADLESTCQDLEERVTELEGA